MGRPPVIPVEKKTRIVLSVLAEYSSGTVSKTVDLGLA